MLVNNDNGLCGTLIFHTPNNLRLRGVRLCLTKHTIQLYMVMVQFVTIVTQVYFALQQATPLQKHLNTQQLKYFIVTLVVISKNWKVATIHKYKTLLYYSYILSNIHIT